MEKEIMLAVICLGFFAMVVLTVYFIMKFRSVSPEKTDLGVKRKSWDWQKPGIVVLGIGLGIFIVGALDSVLLSNGIIRLGIIVICTGIGLVVAQILDKNKSTED